MAAVPQAAELEAMLQTAISHHRAGRLSEAQRLYRDILQVLPDHPVVNNSLGIALKGKGKPRRPRRYSAGLPPSHPTTRRRIATSATYFLSNASSKKLKHAIGGRWR